MNEEQARKLLKAVSTAVPDELTCDECFRLVAKYVDASLAGHDGDRELEAVRVHFSQCACCAYEYETLLEAVLGAERI
jgi:hypothetical protein